MFNLTLEIKIIISTVAIFLVVSTLDNNKSFLLKIF